MQGRSAAERRGVRCLTQRSMQSRATNVCLFGLFLKQSNVQNFEFGANRRFELRSLGLQ